MIILLFIFGAVFGSFLNVVICRLHTGENIIKKPSHCPHCKKKLSWRELIPILSFFILGRKCAECRAKISWQYPVVEFLSGALWVLVFYKIFGLEFGFWNLKIVWDLLVRRSSSSLSFDLGAGGGFGIWDFVYAVYIFSSLLVISAYDVRHKLIPDKIIYPAVIISLLYGLYQAFISGDIKENLLLPLAAALAAFLAFYLIVLFSRGRAMGFGDVKLAFLIGFFLSYPDILAALWWAFVLGAIFGIMLIAVGRKNLKSLLPFGPFLAFGTLIVYFFPWQVFVNLLLNIVLVTSN